MIGKILYVIDRPNLYGSERHVLDTVRYQQLHYEIAVVAFRNGPLIELLEQSDIVVRVIDRFQWIPSFGKLKSFKCIINDFAPDIIHSHQPKANFWSAVMAKRMRIPHIATFHTMPIQAALVHRWPLRQIVFVFHRCIIELVKKLSTHCIYVSKTAMKQLSSYGQNESVIYNWVSPDRNNRHDFHQGIRNYLCVGSISESKGIEELIDWFTWISHEIPDAKLTIVGSGIPKYLAVIKKYIRDKNMENKIRILNYSPDIVPLLVQNDIFISATKSESFGLVFIEAMVQGLPIITRRIPVLEELIPAENLFVEHDKIKSNEFRAFIERVKVGMVSDNNIHWANSMFRYEIQQKKLSALYNSLLSNI